MCVSLFRFKHCDESSECDPAREACHTYKYFTAIRGVGGS